MRISNLQRLKVRLPYPESLLSALRPGLPVNLTSPSVPDITLNTTVSEVREISNNNVNWYLIL